MSKKFPQKNSTSGKSFAYYREEKKTPKSKWTYRNHFWSYGADFFFLRYSPNYHVFLWFIFWFKKTKMTKIWSNLDFWYLQKSGQKGAVTRKIEIQLG